MMVLLALLLLQAAPAVPPPTAPVAHITVDADDNVKAMVFHVSDDPKINDSMKKLAVEASMNANLMAVFLELVARKDKKIDAIFEAHKIRVFDAKGKLVFPRDGK